MDLRASGLEGPALIDEIAVCHGHTETEGRGQEMIYPQVGIGDIEDAVVYGRI
jgi:hypothetical protein